jgi:hypothetical protein
MKNFEITPDLFEEIKQEAFEDAPPKTRSDLLRHSGRPH